MEQENTKETVQSSTMQATLVYKTPITRPIFRPDFQARFSGPIFPKTSGGRVHFAVLAPDTVGINGS